MSSSSNAAKLAQLRAQRIQKKQHEAKLQRRREGKIGIVAERKRKEEVLDEDAIEFVENFRTFCKELL